ncbi:MAG: hypothetical protein ACRDJ5_00475 [Actinomycetota bacterium]
MPTPKKGGGRKAAKTRRYAPEKKEQALALYVSDGPREAARRTKIPANTISSWARRAGLKTRAEATTAKATQAAQARAERIRTQLRAELIEKALEVLHRMDHPHIDFRGKDARKVTFPKPSPTGVREYAVAIGILLDKYRLEMGETTDRKSMEHSGSLKVAMESYSDDDLRAGLNRILRKLEQD